MSYSQFVFIFIDANPDEDTTEQFQVINTAYETLKELIENPPPEPKGWKANVAIIMHRHSTAIHHHLEKDPRLVQSTTIHPMETRVHRLLHLMVVALVIRLVPVHLPMDMDVTAIHNASASSQTKKSTTQTNECKSQQRMDNRKDNNTTRMVPSMVANRQNPFTLVKSEIRHMIMVRRILPIRQSSLHLLHAKKRNATPPPPPPDTTIKNPFGSGPAAGTKRTIQSPFDKGPTTTASRKKTINC